ncbi:MAG: isochorismatase family protein [Actinomycetota bacterium]|jgi:nicotinamidase-related amidase|nr:isochorismatase family protein [Actinomycetota bacterium]MDA8279363.1 isochorismatase family protein [Actinomycetota bacterium]
MDRSAIWQGVITADDEARYAAAGFGQPVGAGRRPALLVIDVQYRTVGTRPAPFFEAVKEFPTSCGAAGWAAVDNIGHVLRAFRQAGFPVLYPHVAPKLRTDAGRLGSKIPGIMDVPEAGYRFVEDVAPIEGDVLLPKKHPSAFFGTPLVSHLVDLGIDTLVITGCTTSGCVRASAVDAFAYNFRVVIPHDAVYDRSQTVHKVNLFDLAQKYADVVDTAEAVDLVHAMAGASAAAPVREQQ